MANRLLDGNESVLVRHRHGKKGYVRLGVDVHPEVKSDLVYLALSQGVSLSDLLRDALDFYLDAARNEDAPLAP